MEALAIDRLARFEVIVDVMFFLIMGPFRTMRDAASIAIVLSALIVE